ncbi:MAG: type 1 glutamine amidotransferase domain-containing protein [Cyanobacteria bacterium P01_A01_bin.114]
MNRKKILMALTNHEALGDTGKTTGFYLSEASHPHKVFTQAGYAVEFVSPQGGKPPIDGYELDDPLNKAFIENPQVAAQLSNTLTPADIQPEDYAAIFYAGGHGTMWDFPENEALANIAAAIYEQGGLVGAVCHGPAGLVNIKLTSGDYLVAGKTVNSFTNEEEKAAGLDQVVPFLLESKLVERGAAFKKSPNFECHVESCDRVVTGQNPASATAVAETMVEQMG